MATVNQVLTSLQKLYERRSVLDKHIVTAEKKLVSEVKSAAKPAAAAKKTTAKKTTAKKTTARKRTTAKTAAKK